MTTSVILFLPSVAPFLAGFSLLSTLVISTIIAACFPSLFSSRLALCFGVPASVFSAPFRQRAARAES